MPGMNKSPYDVSLKGFYIPLLQFGNAFYNSNKCSHEYHMKINVAILLYFVLTWRATKTISLH